MQFAHESSNVSPFLKVGDLILELIHNGSSTHMDCQLEHCYDDHIFRVD